MKRAGAISRTATKNIDTSGRHGDSDIARYYLQHGPASGISWALLVYAGRSFNLAANPRIRCSERLFCGHLHLVQRHHAYGGKHNGCKTSS